MSHRQVSSVSTPYRDHRGAIESMLRHCANPNLANKEGSTTLHLICSGYGDDRRLAETLFELCDHRYRPFLRVDVRDGKGKTPLDLAKKNGHDNLVDFLLERSAADQNLTNERTGGGGRC
uniref:Uncharacterized protein n=1 Tax=Trichogramma kaykai TaxID=54128 RepID=A0ABD2W208_9HYME